MPRAKTGSPAVRAMLAEIGGGFTSRQVERAHANGLGPSLAQVSKSTSAATVHQVTAHYGAILPWIGPWGQDKKKDRRLLLLFLAVRGEPVMEEYVRSSAIAYFESLMVPRDSSNAEPRSGVWTADDAAMWNSDEINKRYRQNETTHKGTYRGAVQRYSLIVQKRREELATGLNPTPETGEDFTDLGRDPGLSRTEAQAQAEVEATTYFTESMASYLSGQPHSEDTTIWTNSIRAMSDLADKYLTDHPEFEEELADSVVNSEPSYREIRELLEQGPIPDEVIDRTRVYSMVALAVRNEDRTFREISSVEEILLGSFETACMSYLHPDRMPSLGRLILVAGKNR